MKSQTFTTMDGLRGVAAIIVVLVHAPASGPFVQSGYLAVDLFFALSGFVLAHSSLSKLTDLRSSIPFIVKRLVRLYPLYAVGLMMGIVAYTLTAVVDGNFWPTGLVVTTSLNAAFLPVPLQFSLNGWSAFPLNMPSWSLAFEMAINLMFALTAFLYTPRRLVLIIAVAAVGLIAAAFAHGGLVGGYTLDTFYVGLARVTFSFSLGVGLYRLWASGWFTFQVPWWFSVGSLIVILCLPLQSEYRAAGDLLIVLVAFPLLLATATDTRSLPALSFLGRISYAVYILHMPILDVLRTTSTHFLGAEFVSFGLAGTGVLLALVFALSSLLDPIDTRARKAITSWIARVPRHRINSERPVVPDA